MTDRLGECLVAALKERNWSRSDGAVFAGISEDGLGKIIRGERSPTLRTLNQIRKGWDYPELLNDISEE